MRKAARHVICLLSLLLFGVSGCSAPRPSTVVHTPGTLPQSSELTVYVLDYNERLNNYYGLESAAEIFKRMYPDVQVTVERVHSEAPFPDVTEYSNRVELEMMAGGGPDVLLYTSDMFGDIYKVMDAGTFMDLSAVVDEDPYFNEAEFNMAVLKGVAYKGRQYIIPLSYEVPYVAASAKEMARVGFDWGAVGDTDKFINEIARCYPQAIENASIRQAFYDPIGDADARMLLSASGIRLVDYEQSKAEPDEILMKNHLEALDAYIQAAGGEDGLWNDREFDSDTGIVEAEYLFAGAGHYVALVGVCSMLKANGEGYMTGALGDGAGSVHATVREGIGIRAGSPNALNAYNFLKIMLSDAVQGVTEFAGYEQGVIEDGTVPLRINRANELISKTAEVFGTTLKEVNWKGGPYPVESLDAAEERSIIELLQSTTDASFALPGVYTDEYIRMRQTILEGQDFVGAYKELKRKLTLYLSE